MRHQAIALLAIGTLSSAPALAKEHMHRGDLHSKSSTIELLENRDDELQRRGATFRIGAVERQEISEQRAKIDDLIDDLEDGKSVDRRELDEALGHYYYHHYHHYHGFHGHSDPHHG